jgi:hypothetical protein
VKPAKLLYWTQWEMSLIYQTERIMVEVSDTNSEKEQSEYTSEDSGGCSIFWVRLILLTTRRKASFYLCPPSFMNWHINSVKEQPDRQIRSVPFCGRGSRRKASLYFCQPSFMNWHLIAFFALVHESNIISQLTEDYTIICGKKHSRYGNHQE